MRITVASNILIEAAPRRVFDQLSDLESWPQWGGNLISMKMISEGPLRVGAQVQQVAKGGRNLTTSILDVTEYVPERSLGIRGPNLEGLFTLEPREAKTRLHARFAVEASGLGALMYRLMLKRFVMTDLRAFRTLVGSSRAA